MPHPPDTCPHCGAEVPPNAKVCPECGSDERTGWSEDARNSDADLPDPEFDYEEFVKREFSPERKVVPGGIRWFWWLIAFLVLVAFIVMLVLAGFGRRGQDLERAEFSGFGIECGEIGKRAADINANKPRHSEDPAVLPSPARLRLRRRQPLDPVEAVEHQQADDDAHQHKPACHETQEAVERLPGELVLG